MASAVLPFVSSSTTTLRRPPFIPRSHRPQATLSVRSRSAISASLSTPAARAAPADLVPSILSKVVGTDRGVLLKEEEHREVARVAEQLREYCLEEPLKSPLIFGEWDVLYCSNPTSPGGYYRSTVGRLIFKTKEMIQNVEAPDIVSNTVAFSLFGFLDGKISLKAPQSS